MTIISAVAQDAVPPLSADTVASQLDDVTVIAIRRETTPMHDGDGNITFTSDAVATVPALFGNADPVRLLQSLPAVRSNADLGSGMFVQGCDNTRNHVDINGAQILNPMHVLGIFSTFNTPHYDRFTLHTSANEGGNANVTGALLSTTALTRHPSRTRFEGSVGPISVNASVKVPVREDASTVTISARAAYPSLLFGWAMKMDHSSIGYNFQDINATWLRTFDNGMSLKTDLFYSGDNFTLTDKVYDSRGKFRWHNIVGSARIDLHSGSHRLSVSNFTNSVVMKQGDAAIDLPSAFTVLDYGGETRLRAVTLTYGGTFRIAQPQYNRDLQQAPAHTHAGELSVAADKDWRLLSRLGLHSAVKIVGYVTSGLFHIYPMARLRAAYDLGNVEISAAWGMHVQTYHCVKESDVGLPTDYFINSDSRLHPATSQSLSVRAAGSIAGWKWNVELYGRITRNDVEYNGAILNFVGAYHNPLDDISTGRSRAAGISVSVARTVGRITGWAGYNLGISRGKFPAIDEGWFPTAHDRRHDFNISASWRFNDRLSAGLAFVYASGLPYTKARYGYMIGENLICEYFPHNSSRLPAYKRLDLSLSWVISRSHGITQRLDASIYNALCFSNVMLQYTSYSTEEGIHHRQSVTRFVIPSVSYTIIL